MRYGKLGDSYLVRLETGDELVASLTAFVNDRRIDAGSVTGLGRASSIEFGLGVLDNGAPASLRVTEPTVIAALSGTIAVQEGRAAVRLHAAAACRDGRVVGGELIEATIDPGAELVVRPLTGYAQRVRDERTGAFELDL